MNTSTTQNRILDAAEHCVLEQGVAHLTLDGVAARAGVSKGGLLYHYGSKDALVAALMARVTEAVDARMDACRAADTDSGAAARAYLLTALPQDQTHEAVARREAALIAALGTRPEQVVRYADRQRDWQVQLAADANDPLLAHIVRLAVDGIWMNEAFGIEPLDPDTRAAVIERLLAITRAAGPSPHQPAPSL